MMSTGVPTTQICKEKRGSQLTAKSPNGRSQGSVEREPSDRIDDFSNYFDNSPELESNARESMVQELREEARKQTYLENSKGIAKCEPEARKTDRLDFASNITPTVTPDRSFDDNDNYLDLLESQADVDRLDSIEGDQFNYFDLLGNSSSSMDDNNEENAIYVDFQVDEGAIEAQLVQTALQESYSQETPQLPCVRVDEIKDRETGDFAGRDVDENLLIVNENALRTFSFNKNSVCKMLANAFDSKKEQSGGLDDRAPLNVAALPNDLYGSKAFKKSEQPQQPTYNEALLPMRPTSPETTNDQHKATEGGTALPEDKYSSSEFKKRNPRLQDLCQRIKRQRACKSTYNGDAKPALPLIEQSKPNQLAAPKELRGASKRQESIQQPCSRQIQSNKLISKSQRTIKSVETERRDHFSDRSVKIKSIKTDFFKKQLPYLQSKSWSSKLLQTSDLNNEAKNSPELNNSGNSTTLGAGLCEEETVAFDKDDNFHDLLDEEDALEAVFVQLTSLANSLYGCSTKTPTPTDEFIEGNIGSPADEGVILTQPAKDMATSKLATPRRRSLSSEDYVSTAGAYLFRIYHQLFKRVRKQTRVGNQSPYLNDRGNGIQESTLQDKDAVANILSSYEDQLSQNTVVYLHTQSDSMVIARTKINDPEPKTSIEPVRNAFLGKANFAKAKPVEVLKIETEESLPRALEAPEQRAKGRHAPRTVKPRPTPGSSNETEHKIRVDSLSQINEDNMQALIKQSVDTNIFIQQVIDYKMNLIDKLNAFLDKGGSTNSDAYKKLEREMKNMVDVDFIRFVYLLDYSEIEGVVKVQRLWRRAIDKTIMKKVAQATREFTKASRLCMTKEIPLIYEERFTNQEYYQRQIEKELLRLNN